MKYYLDIKKNEFDPVSNKKKEPKQQKWNHEICREIGRSGKDVELTHSERGKKKKNQKMRFSLI